MVLPLLPLSLLPPHPHIPILSKTILNSRARQKTNCRPYLALTLKLDYYCR
jgi:hypothetical protein